MGYASTRRVQNHDDARRKISKERVQVAGMKEAFAASTIQMTEDNGGEGDQVDLK